MTKSARSRRESSPTWRLCNCPAHDAADPHELLFDPDCRILATIFRGRHSLWRFARESIPIKSRLAIALKRSG